MVVADVMKEKSAGPSEKGPVDCGKSTSKKGPSTVSIVRERRVRVVQKCKHYYGTLVKNPCEEGKVDIPILWTNSRSGRSMPCGISRKMAHQ